MTGVSAGLPQTLVGTVQRVPGVAAAVGYVQGSGAVAVNGKVVGTGGSPTLFYSYSPAMRQMQTNTYVAGAPPTRSGEVGIVQKLATDSTLGRGIAPSGDHARAPGP